MQPDDRDLDEELRGHLALSIQDRVARGDDPAAARRAALRELGHLPSTRDSMRRVWRGRWREAAGAFWQDVRVGLRSLRRARGLTVAVVGTLALGIGANVAIFSVVRGVLLRPLVNRDEDRLVYIRQGMPDAGIENMTFSMPEIADLESRVTTIGAFGDFSTIDFTMLGLGDPRVVKAGVVSGSFFQVMGLRPVLGRLLGPADDGPSAEGAVVLTSRFWATLGSDPTVIGRTIQLGPQSAQIIGVLEPSVPYPADTEIIANVVTSPHHLSATMVTERTHRMTELFGRLAPGASLETARAELTTAHAALVADHPEAYATQAPVRLTVTPLRDQITAPARPVLFMLLAAAGIVFLIACANVANLIVARSIRRQPELALRAALGASRAALRRMLLAESLVLCAGGAAVGVLIARPLVAVVARFASRFSVRALDVTVDAGLLWVGVGLAGAAAVLLALLVRLPRAEGPAGSGPLVGSRRFTPGGHRRLRAFAVVQVACSFVLVAGAGTLLAAVLALQATDTGFDARRVLAFDLPTRGIGIESDEEMATYQEMIRRLRALPGVEDAALGSVVPWRDAGRLGPGFHFRVEGDTPTAGAEDPFARLRMVGPRFFHVLGLPVLAGREFTENDRAGGPPVVIVSQSLADRLFAGREVLNRTLWWTDPLWGEPEPRRIVGVVADVDDESVTSARALTVYQPVRQQRFAGRLFVRAAGDPYALVPVVTRTVHDIAASQPVERGATLADVRASTVAPDGLNAMVVSGFAGVALLVAVAGVAGVLAFAVAARTREFGVRLAVGSTPRDLLLGVLGEGAVIAGIGVVAGSLGGILCVALATTALGPMPLPGTGPLLGAAGFVVVAVLLAAWMPAARASRVDVLLALKSE